MIRIKRSAGGIAVAPVPCHDPRVRAGVAQGSACLARQFGVDADHPSRRAGEVG